MNPLDNIITFVSSFFASKQNEDYLTWTPSEKETREAVENFLKSELEWIPNAIKNDPALSNKPPEEAIQEVLTYQGLHAIAWHRKANALYKKDEFAEARKISQGVRRLTAGIEIHPGATIGKNFFIDHGAGSVIGETAEIGNNVVLYHRVTLGNDGKRINGGRRHPKIGNNCVIFTGAEILGPATIDDGTVIGAGTKIIGNVHIGKNVIIGPQLLITTDIPDNAKVVGMQNGEPVFAKSKNSSISGSELDYIYTALPAWQKRMAEERAQHKMGRSET